MADVDVQMQFTTTTTKTRKVKKSSKRRESNDQGEVTITEIENGHQQQGYVPKNLCPGFLLDQLFGAELLLLET